MTWETLQNLKISAMKSGDKPRIKVLNDIIVLIQKEQTKGKTKVEITDEMIDNCAIKAQKTLEEMVETCPTTAAYADRLADYKAQLEIVKEYAPQVISDENTIQQLINQLRMENNNLTFSAANRAQVMKLVMPTLKQKHCDMKVVQTVLKNILN